MSISNRDIAQYYDTHQIIYTLFWSRTALHYGFWYEDTKSLAEALLNTNRFVVDALAIDFKDTVLDAGCGVGGTSMHVAETTGAKVEGITLSDVQLKIARKRAVRSPAASLLNFSKQDFTETNFRDNTFSKVFGIESICYAHRKIDFLNEGYRIMKPSGKIAVVDYFLTKENLNAQEMKIYTKTNEGWVVPNVPTKEAFWKSLEQAGFKNVVFYNMLDYIKKSSEKIYNRNLLTYPLVFLKSRLGIGRSNFSPIYQKALFDMKIATYGVFVAVKSDFDHRGNCGYSSAE
jgi:cyclopropane fatty-acyl-phospholipid synthase-like methyltransferase